jgi:hypothetical protein
VVNRTIDALQADLSRYRQLPVTEPSCGDATTFVGYLYGAQFLRIAWPRRH